MLASCLQDPNNDGKKTWEKLIENISSRVEDLIKEEPHVTQSTVKQLVNYLCNVIKHVNYEINFIQARLTNAAFVFAYAFKSLWETKLNSKGESNVKDERKFQKLEYFLRVINTRKMTLGDWDRRGLRKNDKKNREPVCIGFPRKSKVRCNDR